MDEVKVSGKKIAVPNGHENHQAQFFGRILWFTVRACKVPHEELRDEAGSLGLNTDLLPSEMSPRDAFRNA